MCRSKPKHKKMPGYWERKQKIKEKMSLSRCGDHILNTTSPYIKNNKVKPEKVQKVRSQWPNAYRHTAVSM